jgi:thioredoxin-dependent peroxiredoxin
MQLVRLLILKRSPMLKVGSKAPAFTLESSAGEKISLKDFAGSRVVLYFYPKDLTTGCTKQACDFRDNVKGLRKKKITVLGVSKDSLKSHEKFRDVHDLNFPLLSDPDGKVCEAYGVWKEKSMYGRKYMGIERTTFVIGADGKIEKIFEKVKVPGHVNKIVEEFT